MIGMRLTEKEEYKYGHTAEVFIRDLLRFEYSEVYLKRGHHKEFDLVIPELDETWEIKRTGQSFGGTGEVFVEFENRGEPSGLAVSTANFWVFVIGSTGYKIDLGILRWLISNAKNIKIKSGGDDNASKGYIYPIKELSPFAKMLSFDKMGHKYGMRFPHNG